MIVDIHFHMMAQDDEAGCKMSPRLQKSTAAWVAHLLLGTLDNHLADLIFPDRPGVVIPPLSSAIIKQRLVREIDEAREIEGVVLLALDGIDNEQGEPQESHLVTTNEYVRRVMDEYHSRNGPKQLYFGASIHPYRPDALDQLSKAKANGAVLVKWIPSSQQIDPGHPKTLAFYDKMVQLELPLLCHAGWEGAVPVVDQHWRTFENPRTLVPALQRGVTVIIAHCAAPYEEDHPNYVPHLSRMLKQADQKGWKLYADISALLLGPWRAKAVRNFLKKVDHSRLVYGSDFPIPTHDLTFGQLQRKMDITRYIQAWREDNLLDKDVLFKKSLGIPELVFHNTARILLGGPDPS